MYHGLHKNINQQLFSTLIRNDTLEHQGSLNDAENLDFPSNNYISKTVILKKFFTVPLTK